MKNFPFNEVVKTVPTLIADGMDVYQEFTCDGCGIQQTMSQANTFYAEGKCEKCGHVTDIRARGCSYQIKT